MNLTPDTLSLFDSLASDAPNWSGCPLVSVRKEQRGNLTALKRAKLITTDIDEGCTWAHFTETGKKLAAERGNPIEDYSA